MTENAFETLRQISHEDLAERGILRLTDSLHVRVADISITDVRHDTQDLFLTINGTERLIDSSDAERVMGLLLKANGLPIIRVAAEDLTEQPAAEPEMTGGEQ